MSHDNGTVIAKPQNFAFQMSARHFSDGIKKEHEKPVEISTASIITTGAIFLLFFFKYFYWHQHFMKLKKEQEQEVQKKNTKKGKIFLTTLIKT